MSPHRLIIAQGARKRTIWRQRSWLWPSLGSAVMCGFSVSIPSGRRLRTCSMLAIVAQSALAHPGSL